MIKNRHHYVPQFYLRNFSSSSLKQINLYNIKKQAALFNVSIKEQCYKHKFYGKTNYLEDLLALVEKVSSEIIKGIIKNRVLPKESTEERTILVFFIALQMARTKRFADDFNSYIVKHNQLMLLRNQEHFKTDVRNIKIGLKDPVLELIPHVPKMAISINDLKMHLLISDFEWKFITSDSPVFMYNKYCEELKGPTNGLIATGNLMFIPLSPNICLLMYDNSIYKVGKNNIDITNISLEKDLFNINAIQFISADQNLYFDSYYNLEYFNKIHRGYISKRNSYETKVLEFQEGDNTNSSIVVNYLNMPNLNLDLSFLSIRRDAKKIELHKRITLFRRPMPLMPGEEPGHYGDLPRDKYGKVLKKINEL